MPLLKFSYAPDGSLFIENYNNWSDNKKILSEIEINLDLLRVVKVRPKNHCPGA